MGLFTSSAEKLIFFFSDISFSFRFEPVLIVLVMNSLKTQIKSNVFEKKIPEREKPIPFKKHVTLTVMFTSKLVCAMDTTPAQHQ